MVSPLVLALLCCVCSVLTQAHVDPTQSLLLTPQTINPGVQFPIKVIPISYDGVWMDTEIVTLNITNSAGITVDMATVSISDDFTYLTSNSLCADTYTVQASADSVTWESQPVYVTYDADKHRLIQPTDRMSSYAGQAIDIDGKWLMVGDIGFNSFTGAVFIYEQVDGVYLFHSTLETPYNSTDDMMAGNAPSIPDHSTPQFGYSVSIRGDWLAVGASDFENEGVLASGCVFLYYYQEQHWVLQQYFLSPEPLTVENFGGQITITGDEDPALVIADVARGDRFYVSMLSSNTGVWGSLLKVQYEDAQFSSARMAWAGNWLAVGCPQTKVSPHWYSHHTCAGVVLMYDTSKADWYNHDPTVLYSSDSDDDNFFGGSLSLRAGPSGTLRLLVGEYGADMGRGAVHVFEWTGKDWDHQTKIKGPKTYDANSSSFGFYVAMGQEHFLASTYGSSPLVKLYAGSGSKWNEESSFYAEFGDDSGYARALLVSDYVAYITSYMLPFIEGDGSAGSADVGGVYTLSLDN